jgi:hypothetical protein
MLWWVPLSLLLGIWSHTILDAFTHETGWFVVRLQFLHRPWPIYHILQHVGSCLGMAVLAMLAYRRWKLRRDTSRPKMELRIVLLGAAVGASAFLAILPSWNFASRFDGFFQVRAFTFRWIVNSMGIMSCAYLVLALGFQAACWQARATRKI